MVALSHELTTCLNKNGWVELSNDLSHDFLVDCYDTMMELSSSYSHEEHKVADSLDAVPSVLQFYVDLYKLSGDEYREPFKDILISYLFANEQKYELYDGGAFADLENLLTSIQSQSVLVFTGRFRPRYVRKVPYLNALADNQKSANAICVDIDPVSDGDPLKAEALETLFKKCDKRMLPNYISLSGNGFHLWYMFDESVQLFSNKSSRRVKFKALSSCLYDYIEGIYKGCRVKIDRQCANLSRGFRAPGSLTKNNDLVRCFCPTGRSNLHCTFNPLTLVDVLIELLGEQADKALMPTYDDVRFIGAEELDALDKERQAKRRERERNAAPATEEQLKFIQDLFNQGYLDEEDLNKSANATTLQAGALIGKGKEQRELDDAYRIAKGNPKPNYPRWTVAPHRLNTDAIYKIILDNIQGVEVGRRYGALYMLAGVAYMTTNPVKKLEDVRQDFMALLDTRWAAQGNPPLSRRDIEHALLGYKIENWRSKKSEIEALGFNPFNEPQKRNGRSQAEHLKKIARPAYAKKSKKSKTELIAEELVKNPQATKSAVSERTGISYPTIIKYWDDACILAGVEDVRSGNYRPF